MAPTATRSEVDAASAAIAVRLDAAARAIEGQFLQTGDVLSTAVDGVGDLIASLDKLASALDQTMVDATTDDLKAAAEALRSLPEGLQQRQRALEHLAGLSRDLAGRISDMRENLAYLRVVAVYIKIAAGDVDEDSAGFALFAQEIYDCIEVGRTHLEAFDRDLQTLDRDLAAALLHERNLRVHCAELVPATPDAIETSAAALAEQRRHIAGAVQGAAGLARAVRGKVGGVLAALQIGDITRQRLEHVQFGLEALAKLDDLTSEHRTQLTRVAHTLLAAQLAATVDDFHRETDLIDANLAGLAVDAQDLLKLQESAYGGAQREDGDFLRRLETHIGGASGLVSDLSAAGQAALEVGRSAASAARQLSVQIGGIQRMQADVHQMALNTTLRCCRIGEAGRPLTVIAVELRSHATRLEVSASLTLTGLEALTREAAGLAGDDDASGDDGVRAVETALNAATARIRQAGGAAAGNLGDLTRQGVAVVDTLGRAVTRSDSRRQLGSTLDAAVEALAELVVPPSAEADEIGEPLWAYLDGLAKQYSMVQEREVHHAVIAELGLRPPAAATPAVVEAAADPDDVFF